MTEDPDYETLLQKYEDLKLELSLDGKASSDQFDKLEEVRQELRSCAAGIWNLNPAPYSDTPILVQRQNGMYTVLTWDGYGWFDPSYKIFTEPIKCWAEIKELQ